ncbi:hypothetical protein [Heyndrickxia sporothermodurans]|uniref:hypothetical protein n=1 Tax=Heyndrickxia sporothermodurans TaxID=46224 RepID=UPI00192B976A|nr:hypothetical protein [Heyndrickxia sporothermodurans]MBL5769390.1 hypothetical protein [Heyndrickxia sporothermodurans]MBL5773174.1 hypothetical protein [Heyndrickxia sporothermodurans]MBL5776664.1 hypothetical protein [Heyndrickxia sporothermodurans]MBL5783781.1 hypothetical protein [Heyndrickxia sporothermodurans]MBL5787257.1 hypothetical protein [Heyndrickxia sporothermodurans]
MKPLIPLSKNALKNHKTFQETLNVRKSPNEQKRKQRCDRKKDVKIPFNLEQRKLCK